MSLVRAEAAFKIFPAKVVYKQEVKLKPNEHHYENEGEEPYIKYSCPICEELFHRVQASPLDDVKDGGNFARFSFPKGTAQCPCCGINIDWDYE